MPSTPLLTTLRGSLRPTLEVVKTRLVSWPTVSAEFIKFINRDPQDIPYHDADQDLLLRLRRITPVTSFEGGGRVDSRALRILDVTIRTRLELDESGAASAWLTDADFGHIQLEDAVFDALQGFFPEDADGNNLLYEPMRFTQASEPMVDPKEAGWGRATISFEMSYLQPLDQAINY